MALSHYRRAYKAVSNNADWTVFLPANDTY